MIISEFIHYPSSPPEISLHFRTIVHSFHQMNINLFCWVILQVYLLWNFSLFPESCVAEPHHPELTLTLCSSDRMGSGKEYGDLVHRDVHAPPKILTHDQESSIPKAVTLMAHARGTLHTASLFPHFPSLFYFWLTFFTIQLCMLVGIVKFQVNSFHIACSTFYITAYSSSLNPLNPNQPSIFQHITVLTLIVEFFL